MHVEVDTEGLLLTLQLDVVIDGVKGKGCR